MKWLALDVESSGTLKEYGLQPWRVEQRKTWLTSIAWTRVVDGALVRNGELYPSRAQVRAILEEAITRGETIIGWNVTFDIAWLIVYAGYDLVMKLKYLDGMRLWRHLPGRGLRSP